MTKYINEKESNHNDHWKYCEQNDLPFINIIPGKKYSRIEYDVLTMLSFHDLKESPMNKVITIYKAYAEFFTLPKTQILSAGGSNNLIFKVYSNHADLFADKLFDYLVQYVNANRVELGTKHSKKVKL